jgi:HK97 gp10 family phage protein
MQKKILRKGLRAGAKVMQDAAKALAPVRTGKLQSSVKVRSGKSKKGVIKINVGIGAKDFQGETFYGGFVEWLHRIGKRSLGDARKVVPANPFMEKAFEASKDNAQVKAIESWQSEIESELAT